MSSQTTYSKTITLIFIILMISFTTIIAEEAFAPKIQIPEGIENHQYLVMQVESWKVPDKDVIGIPAYPGAFIVAMMDGQVMEVNDDTITTFPSLTIATSDDKAKVTAFYKEHLKDWKYKNAFEMFDIFWIGVDEFNNMDMTQAMTTENLVVFDAMEGEPNFMPEAKTAITIVYKPKK